MLFGSGAIKLTANVMICEIELDFCTFSAYCLLVLRDQVCA